MGYIFKKLDRQVKIWEYYNLLKDPKEISNIYDKNIEEISKMKKMLIEYLMKLNITTEKIN